MMTYDDGLCYADEQGYIVKEFDSPLKAFSGQIEQMCAIAINPNRMDRKEETTALFHELGHCETNSFYNQHTPHEVIQKHENRADKWAIKKLIPQDELDIAIQHGYTEIWELSDYFDVTEDFMRKAILFYSTGSL